jgi:hypothetical protein
MHIGTHARRLAICLIGSFAFSSGLLAQETAGTEFELQLNNASATSDGGCRLTYVATNRIGAALSSISYQVAVFDGDGGVTRILVLEFGALRDGKTKVVQFDLADQPCTEISRIVVNGNQECAFKDETQSDTACWDGLVTNTRTAILFD